MSQLADTLSPPPAAEAPGLRTKHTIRLFPRASGSEAQANPRGPGSPLEQKHREYDTEGETEGGADDHGRDGAVPLLWIYGPLY